MSRDSHTGEPHIAVAPQLALFDDVLAICLQGFPPGQPVSLHASMLDERTRTWTSHAVFLADEQGRVDIASAAPISGSYQGGDPMGLCWSATTQQSRRGTFIKRGSEPLSMELRAEVQGQIVAAATIERHLLSPCVERLPLNERGLVGVFFRPRGVSARPAVLVFGGAEGGLHEGRAALLASWGYPALALAYFGLEGLSTELARIPLEYFATALSWLAEQEGVDPQRLLLMGTSRGGEAALLLGSILSQVRGVIAVVPSGFVWESESPAGYHPAWMWQGQGVPCLRWPSGDPTAEVHEAEMRAYLEANPAAAQAAIPVEHIHGPLLLISGTADRIWLTTFFCKQLVARLRAAHHPHSFQHIVYPEAGHLFTLPHLPTTLTWHGGEAAAMAHANADSWQQIRTFLATLA